MPTNPADRLAAIEAARAKVGGLVTVLDVKEHGSEQANAVDLVWSEVPWLLAELRTLQQQLEVKEAVIQQLGQSLAAKD
jgi:hypothetical protein